MKYIVNSEVVEVSRFAQQDGVVSIVVEGEEFRFSQEELTQVVSGVSADGHLRHSIVQGQDYFLEEYSCENGSAADVGAMTSPMPGKIFKILKEVGEAVKQGETILIMEAMKMEHPVKATRDGKIKEITYKVGEQVAGGVELVVLEDE
jgi:3-methylcrotonyl-CoA carboxylase alpha subunit